MRRRSTRRTVLAGAAGTLAVAGCLDDAAPTGGDGTDGVDGDADADDPAADGDLEWREATLEDVTTGETFAIADLDVPAVLHTFATFCPTCNRQQAELAEVHAEVGDDVAFVDLAIEGGDEPADVRDHADEHGYGWRFAVAPAPVVGALVEEFGQSIAMHSQSPLVLVCPDGSTETMEKVIQARGLRRTIDDGCP